MPCVLCDFLLLVAYSSWHIIFENTLGLGSKVNSSKRDGYLLLSVSWGPISLSLLWNFPFEAFPSTGGTNLASKRVQELVHHYKFSRWFFPLPYQVSLLSPYSWWDSFFIHSGTKDVARWDPTFVVRSFSFLFWADIGPISFPLYPTHLWKHKLRVWEKSSG